MAAIKMQRLLYILLVCQSALGGRLVSTSPQITELLFQLGLGSQTVGTMDGSVYPAEAAKLPSIGQLFSPSLEKTLSLRPSLILLDTHNLNPTFAAAISALKLPSFTWDTLSPESVLRDARRLCQLLETPVPKQVLQWETCLESLRTTTTQIPKLKWLGYAWIDPPILLGRTSFLSRLMEYLGFENAVGPELNSPYLPVTKEWLMVQQVKEVFYLRHASETRQTPLVGAIALDADLFARASLTPLQNLKLLRPDLVLPRSCHAGN